MKNMENKMDGGQSATACQYISNNFTDLFQIISKIIIIPIINNVILNLIHVSQWLLAFMASQNKLYIPPIQ